MKKKQFPIEILNALKDFVDLKDDKFEVVDPGNYLLKIIDKDPESDFYYIAEQYQNNNNVFKLLINYKPKSRFDVTPHRTWIEAKTLEKDFYSWLNILKEYDSIPSFFDDPILKSYEEEYFAEFEIIDEDADNSPFSSKQVLLLDAHLENIEKNIDQYKTEENEERIEEIKNDVSTLRQNLTRKDKSWVVENVVKIWAKITKEGPQLMKDFLSETKKEVIKQGVKGLLKGAKSIMDNPEIFS
ncbi:hypothetical protein [Salinimicrobium xinjiangense]|uniref:hypothetical protein n=1 Tax=Salinimicrobium xinjiangense TaxID=438596 RepID=UPI0004297C9B|nr:hypothetical protein [Salinimicrobium xinjiangense]